MVYFTPEIPPTEAATRAQNIFSGIVDQAISLNDENNIIIRIKLIPMIKPCNSPFEPAALAELRPPKNNDIVVITTPRGCVQISLKEVKCNIILKMVDRITIIRYVTTNPRNIGFIFSGNAKDFSPTEIPPFFVCTIIMREGKNYDLL